MAHSVIPQVTEWQECRNTIARLDKSLAEFRKYSFTIVTGLITAGSLLGKQTPSDFTQATVLASIMWLIAVLFIVDRIYVVIQSAAVERALDIEESEGSRIQLQKMQMNQLTQMITIRYLQAIATWVIPLLYSFLLFGTLILAFGITSPRPFLLWAAFGTGLITIWGYFLYTENLTRTGFWRPDRL